MMKIILLILFSAVSASCPAQNKLIPDKLAFEKKWIKNSETEMTWYMLRDSIKVAIGTISTRTSVDNSRVIIITTVAIPNMKSPWIDSTIASVEDLSPIYHSSSNSNRDMTLQFGSVVEGNYIDKINKKTTAISDTTSEYFFDSNFYPNLIRWLPLKEGYVRDISIYDYNPAGKIGVMKASVLNVRKGSYASKIAGRHPVWIVQVSDEIGRGENGVSTYYIDVNDRRLWKQEIDAGGRKMVVEAVNCEY